LRISAPGRSPAFAEDLEAVARAEHEPAARQELRQRFDDRRAAGHRARAEVITVGEAARKDDAVEIGQVAVPMQHVLDRLA
jgi:hypothetical protein